MSNTHHGTELRGRRSGCESLDRLLENVRVLGERLSARLAELPAIASEFTGYEGLEGTGNVVAVLRDGKPVSSLDQGQEGTVVLDASSFYAERGGQIGDRAILSADGAAFDVRDTQYLGEAIAHHGVVTAGEIAVGRRLRTMVYEWWRREIRRHHTSAHLLQRALKTYSATT